MAGGLSNTGSEQTLRQPIDKRHSKLEHLVPVLHIRDGFDQDLFTIPFNHIINFEYSVMEGKGQASMELYDPTQRMLDVVFFNAAQAAIRGIPLKIRWGYAFSPPFAEIQSEYTNNMLRDEYMSQFYSFYPLVVTPDYQPGGTRIHVNLVPNIFDPVLTQTTVNQVFVTGDPKFTSTAAADKNSQQTALDVLKKTMVKDGNTKEYDKLVSTIDAYKQIVAKKKGQTTPITDPNIGGDVVQLAGKLTFSEIYYKLVTLADEAQTRLGTRRSIRWQKPFPIFPDSIDLNYDYLVFEGRNENVWQCLQRLTSIMVSTDPNGQDKSKIAPSQNADSEKARNRMVGGLMSMHNAPLRNPNSQIIIKASGNTSTTPDKIQPDQQVFMMFQFIEAPYDYMIKGDTNPIATYVYYGGGKEFNQDNLPEVFELKVTNLDALSAYFTNPGIFTLTSVTNPDTGVTVTPDNPVENWKTQPQPQKSLTELASAQRNNVSQNSQNLLTNKGASAGAAGTQKAQDPNASTDPSKEKGSAGSAPVNQTATPTTATQVTFNVPSIVSQDGEKVSPAVDRFLDFLRTRVGRLYYPELEITIAGDPFWEPTYVAGAVTIRLIFRNRFGEENPIFSGIYFVRDIKHIVGTTYKTVLHIVKVPNQGQDSDDVSVADANARKRYSPSQPVETALLNVAITSAGGNQWKVAQTGGSPSIASVSDNENKKRIDEEVLPRPMQAPASPNVVNKALEKKINDALAGKNLSFNDAKKIVGSAGGTLKYNDPKLGSVQTNFVIKEISQAQ